MLNLIGSVGVNLNRPDTYACLEQVTLAKHTVIFYETK